MGKVATEATLQSAVDILKIIAKNNLGTFQNYKDIRNVVRAGMAREYFNVGDQIVTPYAIENDSTYNAPWDVKHIADDGMYLGMHYALPDDIQFDAPEAIYYASEELPAGTYNISIAVGYGNGWASGKSIQFTLANPVPVGGQIYIECGTNNANDPTAGRTLTTGGCLGCRCGTGSVSLFLLLRQTLCFFLFGFCFNELCMKRNKFCGDPSETFLGIYLYPAVGLIGYYQVVL